MRRACVFRSLRLVAVAGQLSAAVAWESTKAEVPARLEDSKLTATYRFQVRDAPVAVTQITSTCACLTGTSDRATYGVGDTGTITATFLIEDRIGLQTKTLVVRLSDGSTHHLILRTTIVSAFEFSDQIVQWAPGEPRTPKAVRVRVQPPHRITRMSASVEKTTVAVAVRPVVEGESYEVVVTPAPTSGKDTVIITVETDHPIPGRARFSLLAWLR